MARMFISLGVASEIVDIIVDEQGYIKYQALSHLDRKGGDELVSAISKPSRMKGGTRNPKINVPFACRSSLWVSALLLITSSTAVLPIDKAL